MDLLEFFNSHILSFSLPPSLTLLVLSTILLIAQEEGQGDMKKDKICPWLLEFYHIIKLLLMSSQSYSSFHQPIHSADSSSWSCSLLLGFLFRFLHLLLNTHCISKPCCTKITLIMSDNVLSDAKDQAHTLTCN